LTGEIPQGWAGDGAAKTGAEGVLVAYKLGWMEETCECLITCRQHGCRCSGNEDELSAEEKKKLKHKKKREVPHRWDPDKGSYRIND